MKPAFLDEPKSTGRIRDRDESIERNERHEYDAHERVRVDKESIDEETKERVDRVQIGVVVEASPVAVGVRDHDRVDDRFGNAKERVRVLTKRFAREQTYEQHVADYAGCVYEYGRVLNDKVDFTVNA